MSENNNNNQNQNSNSNQSTPVPQKPEKPEVAMSSFFTKSQENDFEPKNDILKSRNDKQQSK